MSLFNKGESLRFLGQHEQSIECLNRAIEINAAYSAAYSSKAQTLMELKRFPEAIEAYEKAIAIDPRPDWIKNKTAAIKQQKIEKTGETQINLLAKTKACEV